MLKSDERLAAVPMTARQRAYGWLAGVGPRAPGRPWRDAADPRAALTADYRHALSRGTPLFIAFSGGVDSSLLLAVADHVARREGLPRPIPVTNVYAKPGAADETQWQRLVLEHLGLDRQWLRVETRPEDDLVGPHALEILRRVGVCWPMAHLVNLRAVCSTLPSGAILHTGDGGDEALGSRRVTGLAHRGSQRLLSRTSVVEAGRALAPRSLRRWDTRRTSTDYRDGLTWLRPKARDGLLDELIEDSAREPLWHARGTEYWGQRTAVTRARDNMTWLAAEFGVTLQLPLLTDSFTRALQREGGLRGWPGRADIVRRIAGDVLPEKVINRTTKAHFNNVTFGPSAREVAHAWDGEGLDGDLVDEEALRAIWLSDLPHAQTSALLQEVALLVDKR